MCSVVYGVYYGLNSHGDGFTNLSGDFFVDGMTDVAGNISTPLYGNLDSYLYRHVYTIRDRSVHTAGLGNSSSDSCTLGHRFGFTDGLGNLPGNSSAHGPGNGEAARNSYALRNSDVAGNLDRDLAALSLGHCMAGGGGGNHGSGGGNGVVT